MTIIIRKGTKIGLDRLTFFGIYSCGLVDSHEPTVIPSLNGE